MARAHRKKKLGVKKKKKAKPKAKSKPLLKAEKPPKKAPRPVKKPKNIQEELLQEGHRFSFIQALRLLNRLSEKVRIRPQLSLAHPKSDIAEISETPDKKGFSLTATFLGLYGTSSPLPTFYSEDLFDDAREGSEAARDFLDIFHQRIYDLLFEAWKKYRLGYQISEEKSQAYLGILYALSGLASGDGSHLRYSGLFGRAPRSALGLETLLSDLLGGVKVEVIPFFPRSVPIPKDQRLYLGSNEKGLGEHSLIGQNLTDYQGKFRVKIGPISQERFCSVLQGGEEYKKMIQLIERYLLDPLEYDFEVLLNEQDVQTCVFGRTRMVTVGFGHGFVYRRIKRELTSRISLC